MNLSLDLDVVDAFRAIARSIANTLYNADFYPNYFRSDALNARLPAYAVEDKLRCYCTSYHSQIIFSEIEPIDILSIEIGSPFKFNEHETDVSLRTWNNASDEPYPEELKISEEETITESKDISMEIASAIRAKVGGKTPVFEASLEAEISAKLGVDTKTMKQHRILKEMKTTITTPPWTSSSIDQRHSIADVRQTIRMNCLLGASVSFVSDGSEGRWAKHFATLAEMERYLRGGGGGEDEGADGLNSVVNSRQFQDYRLETEHLELAVERERISRNVRTGETTRRDVPIENPNKQSKRRRRRRGKKEKADD